CELERKSERIAVERHGAVHVRDEMNGITQLDRHWILLRELTSTRLHAEDIERRGSLRSRISVDYGVDARAMAVHSDSQRAEVAHAKAPQALGMQIVEIDVLDRFDPGRLQRRGAADDREIGAAELAKRGERPWSESTLADDEPHPALRNEWS